MKIAVASDRGAVAQHFGHCEGFNIFTVEGGKVSESHFVENPGHKPGFLPNFLHGHGIDTIIAGGMGAGAIEIFDDRGIRVVTGASGDASKAVHDLLEGKLKMNKSVCREHQYGGSCGN